MNIFNLFQNRMWRKTRKPYGNCYGTDPNRNWGFTWKSKFILYQKKIEYI